MRKPSPDRALIISVEKRRMNESASDTRRPANTSGSARVRLAGTCGRSSPDATAPTKSLAISVGGRTKSARGPSVAISQRTTAPASSRSGTVLEDRHDPIELALGIDEIDSLGGDTQ